MVYSDFFQELNNLLSENLFVLILLRKAVRTCSGLVALAHYIGVFIEDFAFIF